VTRSLILLEKYSFNTLSSDARNSSLKRVNSSMYIPNSIKVALAIGHWQLDIGHLGIRNTMQCFA